jgi:hypothetical protein
MTHLKRSDFEPHIFTLFEVEVGDAAPVPIELVEVKDLGNAELESFGLLFKGSPDRVFRHNTYLVRHPRMGEQALFLGPIHTGKTDVIHYQAIFTALK